MVDALFDHPFGRSGQGSRKSRNDPATGTKRTLAHPTSNHNTKPQYAGNCPAWTLSHFCKCAVCRRFVCNRPAIKTLCTRNELLNLGRAVIVALMRKLKFENKRQQESFSQRYVLGNSPSLIPSSLAHILFWALFAANPNFRSSR